MRRLKAWVFRIIGIMWMFYPQSLLAQDLNPDEIRGRDKGEVTKKSVRVLEDRYFTKTYRPEIGVLAGSILDEPYINSRMFGARFGFFFNEWFGVEGQFIDTKISDSEELRVIGNKYIIVKCLDSNLPNPTNCIEETPEINRINKILDANLVFAPFYGKISLKGMMTIYSDTYFTVGASKLDTEQGNKTGIAVGGGQRFYLWESTSVRVDFRNRIFKEQRGGRETNKNSWSVDFGFSYFFF